MPAEDRGWKSNGYKQKAEAEKVIGTGRGQKLREKGLQIESRGWRREAGGERPTNRE